MKKLILLISLSLLASCSPYATRPATHSTGSSTATYNIPPAERVASGTQAFLSDGTRFVATDDHQLPSWQQQRFSGSLKAFQIGCERLQARPQWTAVCQVARSTRNTDAAAKKFFEQYFTPWVVSQNGKLGGKVTGYYEPEIKGSLTYSPQYPFPIYAIPDNFIVVPYTGGKRSGSLKIQMTGKHQGKVSSSGDYTANLADFPLNERSKSLKGRIEGNRFLPFYTRAEINAGALNGRAPILAYAADPVDLFFMHVQGSGRLSLPNGKTLSLIYADKNDQPYVSIGRYMVNKGYISMADANANGIKKWLAQHPNQLAEVLGQNPGYVFFKTGQAQQTGPIGALGVPLTAEYSVAVDKRFIELGSPIFVATTDPRNRRALNRLMIAQDTGSAITGAVRIDFFWGFGHDAGRTAGKMNEVGYVWSLLPNGMMPNKH